MANVREMAERTPARRERTVDLLRAVAITAVVIGHWLLITVEYGADGTLTGESALRDLTWAHPLTWLFQVMPVFFIVGGFANAASLTAHRRRGGADAGWLLDRSARLIRPTTVLLLILAGSSVVARTLGADPEQIGEAVWLASLPLWFLAAYLGMIVLTPVMYSLHQRAGLAVPLLLVLPVVVGDALRMHFGVEYWGYGSFLFGWLAIHQIGFSWRDGRLPTGARAGTALLAGGLLAVWLLTYLGPYPISMVTVPGQTFENSSPPSVALLALATAQLGLALLIRGPCEQWLQRTRPWQVVVAANAVILTLFLWHMSAALLATLVLHTFGILPTPPVDSSQWLLWQIPWIALLAVVLVGLVAVFGRVEAGAARAQAGRIRVAMPGKLLGVLGRPGILLAVAMLGYAAVIAGVVWQAMAGRTDHGVFALPTGALLLFLAGAAGLRVARAAHHRAQPAPDRPAPDREDTPAGQRAASHRTAATSD